MAPHHTLLILQVFLNFQFLIQSHLSHWSGMAEKPQLEELIDIASK